MIRPYTRFDNSSRYSELLVEKQTECLFFLGIAIIALTLLANKKKITSSIVFLIGCLWVLFHDSITFWLYGLGVDSFSELQGFEWNEAFFFLDTLTNILKPTLTWRQLLFFILYLILGLVFFVILGKISKHYDWSKKISTQINYIVGGSLILITLVIIFASSVTKFNEGADLFSRTADNFNNPAPKIEFLNPGIKVIVYIGESTSIMNMGLYGYPRQTTPLLNNLLATDDNFILFKNVFSTHTHTSQSLLEALSVGTESSTQIIQPIDEKRRISLVDILQNNNVPAFLFSNQGVTGTWNLASSIIFRHASRTYSTKASIVGSSDALIQKPNDHEFFAQHLDANIASVPNDKSSVVFLHSYSGHGKYLENIPESFRKPIDTFISSQNAVDIVGDNPLMTKDIEKYDSAIKYIDFSVSTTLSRLKNYQEPVVFMYFSDHGDAVFAGSGHDSARFIHDMARVPFIMYFNAAARKNYPELFLKYQALAKQQKLSTLAQVPITIIDLLGGNLQNTPNHDLKIIGSDIDGIIEPIIVRNTTQGGKYINMNATGAEHDKTTYTVLNDNATDIFSITYNNKNKDTQICYDRSNTIGKAMRGSIIANCLELESSDLLAANNNGNVVHETAVQNILSIVQKTQLALWVDFSQPNDLEYCSKVVAYLAKENLANKNILFNFSANTSLQNSNLLNCSHSIKELGLRIADNVANDLLTSCVKDLSLEPNSVSSDHCKLLENHLQNAVDSDLFTDFAFDAAGIQAMEHMPSAAKLHWNIRNVEIQDFTALKPERFRMIILKNKDPNSV